MRMPHCPAIAATGFDPAEILVAIPYLVGYEPRNSLVCVLLDERDAIAVTMRLDWQIVVRDPLAMARQVVTRSAPSGAARALLAAVSPQPHTRWRRTLSILGRKIDALGPETLWSGCVSAGYWEGALCQASGCVPHALPEPASSDLVLHLIVAGAAPMATRAEVLAELTPSPEAHAVVEPCAQPADLEGWRDEAVEQVMDLVVRDCRPTDGDIACLAAAVVDIRVRDTVLHRITTAQPPGSNGTWGAVWRLMTTAMARTPPEAAAALGAVAALSAWQMGDGLRAGEALARARCADAEHSLARLLQRALDDGLPPEVWEQVMSGLSEHDCRHGRDRDTAA